MKCALLLLASLALANAGLHSAPQLSNGWKQGELLSLDETAVSFTISLKESADAVAQIKKIALDVSDPHSNNYGNYLSSSELAAITAPSTEALSTVTEWLADYKISSFVVKGSRVEVSATHEMAQNLFETRFQTLVNTEHKLVVVRAGDYTLPEAVEAVTAAVFGLHGLPLPPVTPLMHATPTAPADVTPAVLTKTYNIGGVTPRSGTKNKQAVAEFQGQYMSNKDLSDFFKKYLANYTVGTDDVVSKYVGDQDKQSGQTEASLDIQYMMGVAPGIKSEFWLWNSMDFCGDLANWTNSILSDDDAPFVHSISYGWQGDLAQLHCTDDKVKIVDDNFAKLATKGISIIFASGDSGSGYSPSQNQCVSGGGTVFVGTVLDNKTSSNYEECCRQAKFNAWSYTPSGSAPSGPTCGAPVSKRNWKGSISLNVTTANISACCDACKLKSGSTCPGQVPCCQAFTYAGSTCSMFSEITGIDPNGTGISSIVQPPRPAPGNCAVFSAVTSSKATAGAVSGDASHPTIKLWPSWPASSGWITSVGATRFVGQVIGAEEMATDQFGSGGGFSWMFNSSTDAAYQAESVKAYLAAAPQLPPAGSFPPAGRATPDVSALGEGYMVLMNGAVQPVGGTSASTPAFAGMIGLINEARLQAGGKPMGFLNPFIYKNTAAFTDIVKGNNAIGRGQFTLPYGFNCTKGWDPITGVGTPVFDRLLKAALATNPVA